ncbi:MAG: Unknown protein [uncultured Sulfurovum sp.]|uniref:Uncharacterized protein n=1 Tax=uncultured Sulfurovum sp. TaxID=269237 RepID=A0A6S6T0N0_9BACT|nr:MAG: Unknown protein [uncultured Sulfurovum sp.]
MNNSVLIEEKFKEIYVELEKEVMRILMDESLDRKQTNLHMQPLKTTKQILENALDSIKMVEERAKDELGK